MPFEGFDFTNFWEESTYRASYACGPLLPAVLAHMAANSASVLAGQVKLAGENAAGNPAVYYCITAVFLLAGAWCWRYFALKSEAGR